MLVLCKYFVVGYYVNTLFRKRGVEKLIIVIHIEPPMYIFNPIKTDPFLDYSYLLDTIYIYIKHIKRVIKVKHIKRHVLITIYNKMINQ